MQTLPSAAEMYRSIVRRDAAYDGVFYTGVKTTSIFCRPTCPARTPLRKNVEFFASASAALHAGYRPCKRCRPMDRMQRAPAWVAKLVLRVDRDPGGRIRDGQLRAMSIDPARARRYFKRHYGMTFHAYHRARRLGLAFADLRHGAGVARSGMRRGYGSTSGFREAFSRLFGEAPAHATRNGMAYLQARWLDSPLGPLLAIADDDGLCLLEFVDRRMLERQVATLRRRLGSVIVPGDNRHLRTLAAELESYFAGELERFTVPLNLKGSEFQLKVWRRLLQIPTGQTLSYAQLARDIGVTGSQRAVGRANGDNRIGIVIPCHRVVRSDGTLCGYGGGMWRKKWLLEHEAAMQSERRSA